ncbi:MAG: hypothetical protein ACOYM2_09270 [Rectinemataceae bacterium]
MSSQDLLGKLFEVEKQAESLVSDARKAAGARVAAAKDKAETEHAAAYEQAVREANDRKTKAVESVRAEYETLISTYRKEIDATPVAPSEFRSVCEAALGAK